MNTHRIKKSDLVGYSVNALLDKTFGKKGTPVRDDYDKKFEMKVKTPNLLWIEGQIKMPNAFSPVKFEKDLLEFFEEYGVCFTGTTGPMDMDKLNKNGGPVKTLVERYGKNLKKKDEHA